MSKTRERDIKKRRKKWVKRRAHCTRFGVFKKLTTAIKDDVDRFNELSDAKVMARGHYCWQEIDNILVLVGIRESLEYVRTDLKYVAVRLEKDCISVYCKERAAREEEKVFDIHPEWNHDAQTCDLTVDGKKHTIRQLSEMCIGDLLFERRPVY